MELYPSPSTFSRPKDAFLTSDRLRSFFNLSAGDTRLPLKYDARRA